MIKYIFHIILGWKIIGYSKLPTKCIVIAAPHTHWLDLFLGLAIRNSVGEDIKFIGKKELFIFPLNYIMRYIGGIPVNRNSKTKNVDQIATLIQNSNNFKLAISPEGTRKKVTKWKTGFYYIAKKTNIPIVCISLNFKKRKVSFFKPYKITGDIDSDLKNLRMNFRGAIGKIPEYS
tara:strand:+ start:821 stop:1348 length:528 start_codon:yes stop_codon:yes gene_type:complete